MPLLPSLIHEIKIEALRTYAAAADGSVSYEGEVVVRYDGTKILADRVTLYQGDERGVAEGHVLIVDPDGTAHADRLEFVWKTGAQVGIAENVTMRVANTTLHARHGVFRPAAWTLSDVEGTTCLRPDPAYLITTDTMVVHPGQDVYIHKPKVSIDGHYIGQLPSETLSLTPAVAGLHYPSISYKVGRGFGVSWSGAVAVGHDNIFSFGTRASEQRKPGAAAQYTHSFLPLTAATQIVPPRSDFGERFNFGFMDSVAVLTPEQEQKYVAASRSSISGGFQVNGSASDRDRGTRYNKLEAVYERGTASGHYGFLGDIRIQDIEREQEGFRARLALSGSTELPSTKLTGNLATLARIDNQVYLGTTAFGWTRAMAGLSYNVAPWLRLSSAGYLSTQAGDPEFDIDPLYSKVGVLYRADFALAGLKVSFLTKDDARHGFYDHEFAVRQVVGCVEVYYLRRQFPLNSRIGITLRVQPLLDVLHRRTASEAAETAKGK